MKEDVVAANLANLRQSINELKECVNRQNVTPNQPEQHIKVDLDEKTIYNGVAKTFCSCWNDGKHPIKYPFSLLYFHCTFAFAILHELLTYFHYDTRTI